MRKRRSIYPWIFVGRGRLVFAEDGVDGAGARARTEFVGVSLGCAFAAVVGVVAHASVAIHETGFSESVCCNCSTSCGRRRRC